MKTLLWVLAVLMCSLHIAYAEIKQMELRGQGDVKYMGLIKVYDAYLYTEVVDAEDILATDISKCLQLNYAVSLSPKDIIAGAEKVLKRQHLPERLLQIQAQIETINNAYQAIGQGDQYRLCYDAPSAATTLYLNQKPLVVVASADFGKIYFGIWLGPRHPIDKALRDDLLSSGRKRLKE